MDSQGNLRLLLNEADLLLRVLGSNLSRPFICWPLLWLCLPLLAQDRPMRFVYFNDYPPFSYADDQGQAIGLFIAVFREIFENRMGLETEHDLLPWARAQYFVRTGQADAFCTVPTPERKIYTQISTTPVVEVNFGALTHKDHPQLQQLLAIQRIEDLQHWTIASYIGSLWADRNVKGTTVYRPHRLENAIIMVDAGRADLVVGVSQVLRFKARRIGFSQQLVEIPAVLDRRPFHLCIARNSPYANHIQAFDRHLNDMITSGLLAELIEQTGRQ